MYLRLFDCAVAVSRNGGAVRSPPDFVLCIAAKQPNMLNTLFCSTVRAVSAMPIEVYLNAVVKCVSVPLPAVALQRDLYPFMHKYTGTCLIF